MALIYFFLFNVLIDGMNVMPAIVQSMLFKHFFLQLFVITAIW